MSSEDREDNEDNQQSALAGMLEASSIIESETDDEGDDEDSLARLPDDVLRRIEALRELNKERDDIMERYLLDRAALEKKYASLCLPLYKERADIVQGKKDKTFVKDKAQVEDSEAPVKGIPQFWVCSMTNMESVAELITEEDVGCLDHLLDVTCTDREDGRGFTLEFHFSPNDYFTDTVLTKTYEVPNLLLSDEPILKNVDGYDISWKADRSLTYRMVKKKQRGKGKNVGQIRSITKKERKESFFHWFDPPTLPESLAMPCTLIPIKWSML